MLVNISMLTDSFGNALGDSIVDGVDEHDQPTMIVTPLSAADDPSNWSWDEQDVLSEEREAALVQHFANLNKEGSISGGWAWSGACTVDNPYGFSQAQVRQKALSMVMDSTRGRAVDRLIYDSTTQHGQRWESMQEGWMGDHIAYLKKNGREAEMLKIRNNSTHWQIAQGVADAWGGLLLARNPVKLIAALEGTELMYRGYQHREQLGRIAMESIDNGGFTLAVGVSPSYSMGSQQDAVTGGSWMSVNWEQGLYFNGGGYLSAEYGGSVSKPNMSFDVGVESILFTSSDYDGALSGNYQLVTSTYNSHSISYIRANGGDINGY